MNPAILYLVTVLLELNDTCVTDEHHLYASLSDAKRAVNYELAECQQNFEGQNGEFLIDLDRCQEWRNEDGFGYTVCIEEIQAK